MNILLINPPLVQLNTPYQAISGLCSFLRSHDYEVAQYDIAIELINRIFTRDFLSPIFAAAYDCEELSDKVAAIAINKDRYLSTIEVVIRFLQGRDDTLALRIASRDFLPEGPRFRTIDQDNLDWNFGNVGIQDKAKYLATLYLEDLSDFISELVSPDFGMIKYAEQIALFAPNFEELEEMLHEERNMIELLLLEILKERLDSCQGSLPNLIGFSIPFPGTLASSLLMAKYIKEQHPDIKIVFGGGYINTELRQLSDTSIFKYTDYICFDDGELPLLRLCEFIEGKCDRSDLVRTIYCEESDGGLVIAEQLNSEDNIPFKQLPAPVFDDIQWEKYISTMDMTNPMHRLWSDGKWIKLTFAHGCYWAKCAFCDTTLDYIKRFETQDVDFLLDKIELIIKETGIRAFHFIDEALPPKLLIRFAEKVIERKLIISFWGNVRFDTYYSDEHCSLLAQAGCIAVSGGLEVASERVLKLINKGISLKDAKFVLSNFSSNGILVHAYLMYGFPTQSYQETIDSLEVVRQFFEMGLIHSGFWHRFALTLHSPVGQNPELFKIKPISVYQNYAPFANNALDFEDPSSSKINYNKVDAALKNSIYNYMQGVGFDIPINKWFKDKNARPSSLAKV